LAHQLLNHLLLHRQRQKRDLGDPSLALSDGCNGLRTRSLKLLWKLRSVLIRPLIATPAQGISRS
jgi:hypothetical protein